MKKVTVYTQDICPYCTRAKNLLRSKNISFSEINLDERPENEWRELTAKTGHRTLPQIFIGEEFIGGYDELSRLDSKGELDRKINS